MDFKIGVIASEIEMMKTLSEMFPSEVLSGNYMIRLLDRENIDKLGVELMQEGADLVIARSGGYQRNVDKVSIPVLRLKVSTGDIMNALRKAMKKGNKIDLVIWDQIDIETELFELIDAEVRVHTFPFGDKLETIFEELSSEDYDGVMVGGGIICRLANEKNIKNVFISPSESSIRDIFNYAKQILTNIHEVKYKNELLSTVVKGGYDSVIAIDEKGKIILYNDQARDILKMSPIHALGYDLTQVLPEFSFIKRYLDDQIEVDGMLMEYEDMTLTYNSSMIKLDGIVKGCLFSFQNITKLQRLERKIRLEMSDKGLIAKYGFNDIIYSSPLMKDTIERAKKVGQSDSTVIIYGESGTGKELMASSLHQTSKRSKAPFVAVNCAALSESLLESELFGYEEGAFTGARKGGKIGLFELAHSGTVFLDEINSMSMALQAKLLRVVEAREVMRIGSDRVIPLDVRIICASNEQLVKLVTENRFRTDLFYRLSSLQMNIPSLRERREDIIPLFEHFLYLGKPDAEIRWPTESEKARLKAYAWPGNIRELKNVSESYLLFDEIVLLSEDQNTGQNLTDLDDETSATLNNYNIDLKDIHKIVDKRIINQLLETGMNKTQIAEILGISRTALWKKIND